MRSFFSNTVTKWPARASCWAQARPGRARADHGDGLAGALRWATCGVIQPSCQPRSTIAHSIVLIVTGLSSMFSVQHASHGAGQMRPVNSGKLLVECRISSAFCQSSS